MPAHHIVNGATNCREEAPIVVRPRPGLAPRTYGKYQSKINSDPRFKAEARDRAAYVYITGTFPTHLRKEHTGLIRTITGYSRRPASLDGTQGNFKIMKEVIDDLQLDEHPMVVMMRRRMAEGWRLQVERATTTRRPYSKIFMWRRPPEGMVKITVKGDGAIKESWE